MEHATQNTSQKIDSKEAGEQVFTWWVGLEHQRGERAALRRCQSIDQVYGSPAFYELQRRLQGVGVVVGDDQLAAVAGLLSHVREHVSLSGEAGESSRGWGSFATHLATPREGGGDAKVSGLRFRRLLRIEDREELYGAMVRLIRMLNGKVDVHALTRDVVYWGPERRKRWAQDYYSRMPQEA
ncbi:type I-E CRISPR-associated protein Cse2/CasB [Lujinxingia sediminis]|uniref:Type I-E CRISPR-associated protein Cse2/CasB n=1 Tax=Lujinxingia sediminis TaxID=2480984 RepID=A0ABY0CUK8_9DELT|nr:type I-E CRISPR-associated protein Cse2/CasB [Lujinxingia sediminis]RVU45720.1 type I-E CRISPR-associated protein Cse2/CasB [Lujinxingia sediminis]